MKKQATLLLVILMAFVLPVSAQSTDCHSGDPDKAIAGCTADIQRATPVPTAQGMLPVYYSLRAAAYQKKDMFEPAKADLDMAVSLQPEFPAYFNRAVFFSDYGMTAEALADFAAAIALYEKKMPPEKEREEAYVQANLQRAEALRRIGRPAEALVNFDKAAALRPDNMEIFYNRALANSRLERLDAVIADLTRVIDNGRREGFYVSSLINRGLAHMRRNDFPAAVADLDRALAAEPGSPLGLVRRGYIYERAGQREKAVTDYRAALGVYSRMEEAIEGLKRLGAAR